MKRAPAKPRSKRKSTKLPVAEINARVDALYQLPHFDEIDVFGGFEPRKTYRDIKDKTRTLPSRVLMDRVGTYLMELIPSLFHDVPSRKKGPGTTKDYSVTRSNAYRSLAAKHATTEKVKERLIVASTLRPVDLERLVIPTRVNIFETDNPGLLRWYFTERWLDTDKDLAEKDVTLDRLVARGEFPGGIVVDDVFQHAFDRGHARPFISRRANGLMSRNARRELHDTLKAWDVSGDETRERVVDHYITTFTKGWQQRTIKIGRSSVPSLRDMIIRDVDRKQFNDILFNWSPRAMRTAINATIFISRINSPVSFIHLPEEYMKANLGITEKENEPGTFVYANPVHEEHVKDLVASKHVILACSMIKDLAWKETTKTAGDENKAFLDVAMEYIEKRCK